MMEAFVSAAFPMVNQMVQKPPLVEAQVNVPALPDPTVNPDQLQAVDAVFSQHQESAGLVGLLASWGGTMLLADLAKEHLNRLDEDDEEPGLDPDPENSDAGPL